LIERTAVKRFFTVMGYNINRPRDFLVLTFETGVMYRKMSVIFLFVLE